MIAAVATAAQRQAFLEAARRDPMLHAVLGRDLTLWAGQQRRAGAAVSGRRRSPLSVGRLCMDVGPAR